MRRSTLAMLVLCLLCSCGPDLLVGTYSFTFAGTETETAPQNRTLPASGVGSMAVTTGKKASYVVTLAEQMSGSSWQNGPCVLEANRGPQANALTLIVGQTCSLAFIWGPVTATVTSGTVVSADQGESLSLQFAYSYEGVALGTNYVGTGTRTYTGPKR